MTTDTNDANAWLPFGMDQAEASTHTALRKDIPDWLATSLWGWIKGSFTLVGRSSGGATSYSFNLDLVLKCERALHIRITSASMRSYDVDRSFTPLRKAFTDRDDMDVWRLVDFCLAERHRPNIRGLNEILTEAGSAWTTGERFGKPGLVQRMPDGVALAADLVFQQGTAGKRLASAWESAFGITPDPETAYSRSVKAVEDASIPLVVPTGANATLGTVIREIRQSGNFKLPHLREHPTAPTHDVLVSMLQMLWTGQHDRHGGPSTVPAPNVTQAEAETAVMLAVTLVGWFETAKVQP